jgi:hypothetical protein
MYPPVRFGRPPERPQRELRGMHGAVDRRNGRETHEKRSAACQPALAGSTLAVSTVRVLPCACCRLKAAHVAARGHSHALGLRSTTGRCGRADVVARGSVSLAVAVVLGHAGRAAAPQHSLTTPSALGHHRARRRKALWTGLMPTSGSGFRWPSGPLEAAVGSWEAAVVGSSHTQAPLVCPARASYATAAHDRAQGMTDTHSHIVYSPHAYPNRRGLRRHLCCGSGTTAERHTVLWAAEAP